ncbi:MAG: NADPH-dependent FMN reductase [Bdellovibrionales bacterium GWA2_49_15]|nr:MAG: NADPH-dependent FMN reductase [Bdellovibrionales bacterium GWA2_49_15]HAZ14763.1 NADPH-dependent FMN reductase [Bdellovibrionales bacterium]
MKIVGLSGSLRAGSYNTALLKSAREAISERLELKVYTLHDIPLYDGDKESSEGIPWRVKELKEELISSDGLLIVTPEYNHSIPGVLKNAIDWLSRPPEEIKRVFGDRPVALMGASPSGFGTVLAQEAWLPILRTLGMKPWFGKSLHVANADEVFDHAGKITDARISLQLQQFMQGFQSFIEAQPAGAMSERPQPSLHS